MMNEKSKVISIRLETDFYNDLKEKALLENIKISDLIHRAITEYMYKDVNIQNELLGTLEQINKNLKSCLNNDELFLLFFTHYLKYFFVLYNDSIAKVKDVNDSSLDLFKVSEKTELLRSNERKKGAKQRDEFFKNFGDNKISIKKYAESKLADLLVEEGIING